MCEKVRNILMSIYFVCIYLVLLASFCYFQNNLFLSHPKHACVFNGLL
jgi:hypothetical protein